MTKISINVILVLAIIYVVPFIVYGLASAFFGLPTPEGVSPLMFLVSVLVSKIGASVAFVLIFYFARNSFRDHWFLYAIIWWTMFVIGEVGQAIGPHYSWSYAIAGIISETIYFPASSYVLRLLSKD
ncbi:MAG: hypothetical protein P4L81_02070 [Candidatus Pacebacteria bacterium]|nr:hypothetical protein [Candidatus Paceibacterota bacterium]